MKVKISNGAEHKEHLLLEAWRQSQLIAESDTEPKNGEARLVQAMESMSDIKDWTTGCPDNQIRIKKNRPPQVIKDATSGRCLIRL